MSHDADLHHAISLKPHPFHTHPAQQQSYLPLQGPAEASRSASTSKNPGVSTAYLPPSNFAEDPNARQRPVYHRNSSEHEDVERGNSLPNYDQSNDPFSLRDALKTDDEIHGIRANVGKKRTCGTVTYGLEKPMEALRAKRLQGFYEKQNENIERLLKPVDDHVREAKEEQGADALQYKIAVTGSFVANILLAVLQLYGAISSGSLSLFTTMADAIFDPCSNLTLILCNRAVNRVDPRRFPSGKARIETAGNIAFCFLMTAVSLILIVQSAVQLARNDSSSTFYLPSVIAVAVAFATKLGLFLYCWALRNKYSQIRILWEDHRNDLFINGFGLLTSVGGSKLRYALSRLAKETSTLPP